MAKDELPAQIRIENRDGPNGQKLVAVIITHLFEADAALAAGAAMQKAALTARSGLTLPS